MTEIGPLTESGAAVVPQRPTTEAERLEWLVRLCEGLVMSPSGWTTSKLRDALAPAARTWTADALGVSAAERESERETRDDLIEALERLNECRQALGLPDATTGHMLVMEVRAMAGRIAQLEEALAAAGREAADVVASSPFLVTREADGRWLADCGRVPGAMAYGTTAAEARAAAAMIVVCRCESLEEERQAEQQRHAVEMGEMRSALLHLSVQLAREIRRGGGA